MRQILIRPAEFGRQEIAAYPSTFGRSCWLLTAWGCFPRGPARALPEPPPAPARVPRCCAAPSGHVRTLRASCPRPLLVVQVAMAMVSPRFGRCAPPVGRYRIRRVAAGRMRIRLISTRRIRHPYQTVSFRRISGYSLMNSAAKEVARLLLPIGRGGVM